MKKTSAIFALLGAFLLGGPVPATAQTTDGYHSIQIFPLVVDTASFATRMSFRNPNSTPITLNTRFYPANGTAQTVPLDCTPQIIPANQVITVTSLKSLCPALASGPSQFGFLYTSETSGANLPYAGFSRVSNPLGNGFTVEAFPPHVFTSADGRVTGIRRLAASGGSPAFQTNCFIGNLNDVQPQASRTATPIVYTLYDSASNPIASSSVSLLPGQVVRLLDVFSIAPAGDYNDAQIKFEELGNDEPSLLTYCTVQDNTSFGADFRIAKQEYASGTIAFPGDVVGSQDAHVSRETRVSSDSLGRVFEIGTGAASNTHVIYFRHPDYTQCELLDSNNVRLTTSYGLEMRMLDQTGQVIAGGDNQTGWGEIYMGDKTDRNNGSNTRYTIEVEDIGVNTGSTRPYKLHCQSGSGHSLGDLIRYKEAVTRF